MNITVVVSAVAGIAWLAVVGLLALTVIRASRGQVYKGSATALVLTVVLALLLSTFSRGLVFIKPEERGVVISALQEGVRPEALTPGLKWVVPYFEDVITYPIS
ncbi:MAG: hypothetical protein JW862_15680, partial [Anaerolineales bacterium]|nr:hypothetical protein [Anaerolineales bacterium]